VKITSWIIAALVLMFMAVLFQSAAPFNKTTFRIIIPKGVSTYTVRSILEKEGIVKSDSSFAYIARVLGAAKHIKAGEYELSPSDTLLKIILKLKRGEVLPSRQILVTFPEGTSIYKMGEILKINEVGDPEKFQDLIKEGITREIREQYWHIFKYIPSESLEGYLYPDSYYFFNDARVADLVSVMLKRFNEVVIPFWLESLKDTKYNLHEILTLASIIEKESKVPEERAIISSVFHNRLKIKMPLAADPTIKYALERPTQKVYLNQLEVDSLYNTYKRRGLPPGPICNPGIESIKAALYPAQTNYFYFVAGKDGSHIFSRTWAEHQIARAKVQ